MIFFRSKDASLKLDYRRGKKRAEILFPLPNDASELVDKNHRDLRYCSGPLMRDVLCERRETRGHPWMRRESSVSRPRRSSSSLFSMIQAAASSAGQIQPTVEFRAIRFNNGYKTDDSHFSAIHKSIFFRQGAKKNYRSNSSGHGKRLRFYRSESQTGLRQQGNQNYLVYTIWIDRPQISSYAGASVCIFI